MAGAGTEVGRISIKVTPDTDGFRRELKKKLDEIENTMRGKVKIDAEMDASGAKQHLRAVIAELKAMAKAAKVTVPVDVDRNGFAGMAKDVEKAGDSAMSAGRSFMGLTRIGWLVSAVFAAAAPAIGLVSGLLAGLPSLISMFGAGAVTIALGMDGIKKAAMDAGLFGDSNGAKNGGGSLGSALTDLKTKVSEVFATGLVPMFEKIAGLAQTLTPQFQGIAKGLVDMFGGVTTALTSAEGVTQLQTIMAGVAGFFTQMAPQMQQFTNSFLQLGAAGASNFGVLQGALAQFATQWQGMVDRVTTNGDFNGAMKGLSETLSGLTDVFTRLFESGLKSMGQLGGPLNTMFKGLGDALVAAMPALTSFSGLIANVIGTMGTSLAPIITELTPAFTQLANILGTTFASGMATLTPMLTSLAKVLGQTLLTSLQQIMPYLPQMMASFQQIAQVLAAGIIEYLPQLAAAFIQMLPAVLQLVPSFIQLVNAMLPFAPMLIKIVGVLAEALNGFMTFITILLQVGAAVAGAVSNVISFGTTIARIAMEAIPQFVNTIRQGFADAVAAVVSGVANIIAEASTLGGKIMSAVSNFGSLLINAGKALMDGLLNGIKAGFRAVMDFVGSIAGWIKDHKGPISYDKTVLIGNGEALMEGLDKGLSKGFDSTLGNVKDMAKQIFEAIKEVFGSANGLALNFNFAGGGGGSAVTGLAGGIGSLTAGTKQFQSSLSDSVNPAKQVTAETQQQTKDLSQQLAILEMRRKELEISRAGLDPKSPEAQQIKDELEKIRLQKLQLGYQKDQLSYAQKYEGSVSNTTDQYAQQASKMMKMPQDFASATGKQFMSDIGIGGNGVIGKAISEGIKYVFNIGSVDDAMSLMNRQDSMSAIGMVGR